MNTQTKEPKERFYIKYSNYHLWAVFESKFDSVVASFNTQQEAIKHLLKIQQGRQRP